MNRPTQGRPGPLWDALLKWRWPLWGIVAVVAAVLARSDDPPDLLSFSERGALILNGHLGAVYTGHWNQAGPLQLLEARLLMLGSSTDRPLFGVELGVDLALLALLWAGCRRWGASPACQFVVAGGAVVWLGPAGLWSGHPSEVVIALLWLAGGARIVAGRWLVAGLLLGAAGLVAPWAVLALPVVFIGRKQPTLRALAVAVALTLGGYLPFVLSGHFDMFGNVWVIDSRTLAHVLLPGVTDFSWSLRVAQAAAAAGVCLLVTRWGRLDRRGHLDARWAAPLLAVLVRILLDPVLLGYYWLPAGVLVLAGAAMRRTSGAREIVALSALGYLTYFGSAGVAPVLVCAACIALTVFVLAVPTVSTVPTASNGSAASTVPAQSTSREVSA